MVLYPGWSARDNYGKRKKENPTTGQMVEGNHHGYIRGITINNNYSTISTPY